MMPGRKLSVSEPVLMRQPVMSERRVSLLGGLFVAIGPISMALYTPAMPEIVSSSRYGPGSDLVAEKESQGRAQKQKKNYDRKSPVG